MKLILGSGPRMFDGWTTLDKLQSVMPDIVHDLSVYPWPVESNSVDEFVASHVIEHVIEQGKEEQFFAFFRELWRICQDGASGVIVVPDATKGSAFSDPGHKSFYSKNIFTFISKKSIENNIFKNTRCTAYEIDFDFDLTGLTQINDDIHCTVRVVK